MNDKLDVVIAGAGAAGCFAGIRIAELQPTWRITIFESSKEALSKVRISGGGRCNVTHNEFDANRLITNYPRGAKELKSVFARFQPQDTLDWFAKRGIKIQAEADGRMFPSTNSSATIIDCFLEELESRSVEIHLKEGIRRIEKSANATFQIELVSGKTVTAKKVLLATGSSPAGHKLAKGLGHTLTDLAPSLFTFHAEESQRIAKLAGVSVADAQVRIKSQGKKFEQRGPVLFTHWGFSGPAVLKLSAFAARELQADKYRFDLQVDWLPRLTENEVREILLQAKQNHGAMKVANLPLFRDFFPRSLWSFLLQRSGIDENDRATDIANKSLNRLTGILKQDRYAIIKKSLFKEEFVTCGGVKRSEIDFRTMQSKLCPHLFFAGELIDVDGITGGFNFQNAWSGAWIAAEAICQRKL